MARANKHTETTEYIELRLTTLEASVLSAILCKDTGYESADDILGALTEAGVAPFGEAVKAVFAPLADERLGDADGHNR